MRECLIMSTHTKYEHFKYENVKEIPTDWIKRHIGNWAEDTDLLPKCPFNGITLKGYKYYKVYKCAKGKLQYYNNEIAFFYNTGSYMYIRFLYHNDCEEYLKLLLKDYDIEFKQNFCINNYMFNCGDVITFKDQYPMEIDTEFYEEMMGLPKGSTTLEYFDKNKQKLDAEQLEKGIQEGDDNYFQVQTIYEDGDGIYIIPAVIPDVTQFRLKGVPGCPYFAVGPINLAVQADAIEVYKNFEDDSTELE